MVATVGSIRTVFEADMRAYSAGLAKGERATGIFSRRVGDHVSRTQREMAGLTLGSLKAGTALKGAFAGMAAGAVGVLAPILSVAGALKGAKDALSEFDRIGKAAKASGLDSEFFQELQYAAELGGVGVDQLSQALNAFNRNAGLAAIGKGELVEKLKQLDVELLKNIANARTQEERLRILADALAKETDASRRAAIASAAFGDAGVKMVEVLKGGSAALDETAAKARSLGIVVDRELIARSETLNDEFSTATKVIDLQFKQALVNLAPILIGIAERAAVLTTGLRNLIDSMRDLENQSSQSLGGRMRELGMERLEIERQIIDLQNEQRTNASLFAGAENKVLDGKIAALKEHMAALTAEEARILKIMDGRKPTVSPLPVTEPVDPTGSRQKAAEAALKEAERVKELIEKLQIERNELGLSETQRKVNNALREAGAAATEEEKAQIASLITQIEAEREARERAREELERRKEALKSIFDMGADALSSIVDGSESAEQAVKKLAVQLAIAAAQAALLGEGPLAGIFGKGGGLFGGKGGLLGGIIIPGILHEGGDAGGASRFRAIPAKGIGSAPRYHSGVGHNELLAVLEKTESVLTKNQMSRTVSALRDSASHMRDGPVGGNIEISGTFTVENGNLVPIISAISGQIAGQQIKQVNRNFRGRIQSAQSRGI